MKNTIYNRNQTEAIGSTNNHIKILQRLFPDRNFNARAVRARAGVLNLIIGATIALTLARPDLNVSFYASSLLLFDMIVAVAIGLVPMSPTGVFGTILTAGYTPVPTPHLPKRFAWSMGTLLAATCLALTVLHVDKIWLVTVWGVFFLLTWLDAALGFCVGCWIYSRLFGCQACRVV